MYIVSYLRPDYYTNPEDSEIRNMPLWRDLKVSGVFEDKAEAEEWAKKIGGVCVEAKYYPKEKNNS